VPIVRKTSLIFPHNTFPIFFMQRGLDSETKKQLEDEAQKIISEDHRKTGSSRTEGKGVSGLVGILFGQLTN
uniref:Uncharacterized protein n=1 Tax=Anolis carolinensis TaxID=28377 RepID=A0A803U0X8_ANOCA